MSAEFPETHWSQLLELRDPAHPRYAEHLDGLARRYWKPVYHFARALRRANSADAEDLTQQFFAMLLARRDLQKLTPDRGSFRGFLKTAIRHFVASADRAAAARTTAFPFPEAETEWARHPDLGPEEAFDREWARGVLVEATGRLREESKGVAFEIFREYCLEDAPAGYADLARKHGIGEDDVRNSLRASRQRIREILQNLLRDYLLPGQDVEAELRFILAK
jgi:RNA polymerase sigma-70 factor (ECF subfamily)